MAKLSFKDQAAARLGADYFNPYLRTDRKAWQYLFNPGAILAGDLGKEVSPYDANAQLRNNLGSQISGDAASYWNSLTDKEKNALLSNYWEEADNGFWNLGGLSGSAETFDVDQF